ncbi:MAG: type II toxin-antitoxin system prevent-host-death family antitoxin [Zoogloeaceae bacterium]|nr:type II toxin-antitoxin system prevent-host-death family antitoxin [Zoogloeaceae bacterium]
MKTISSREVQKNFGSVADRVAAGESVRITRHGRPAFLLIPDTGDGEEILQELAARRLARMLRQAAPAPAGLPVHAGEGGLADGLDGLSNQALYAAAEHDA